ncbi:dihydrolipoyllysine-residue succinyltransferase component of 2-oxoglutarate dehydrogenase complex 1, mitochondrial-like isoform X1 [Juglans microcarpa x Juglans regia]|uniref:dihydrolipoyllysine-residue succinyltransferase component of 2-oxoglutarate dehydrogenase complex 1, mitochondrial-like isoform X1 n=1 Tax=Juglans microcarpa x Juglans regia TaxID=2249226 RepID=UPI001B7ED263|nr:dihydrolipoyllysine-residue succinyltransferase component of 2-oxoglutarate dehydrogenase complex 1, mitochondrial-like isoform X1 [Juglans microcarpa x Juglans regia]
MWAIIRRKVVNGSSTASVFGRPLRETRLVTAPATRSYSTNVKERLLLGRGSKIVGSAGLHGCLGCPISSKTVRERKQNVPWEVLPFLQTDSPNYMQYRSFSSDNGDLVDAVVPFMGESITDGTLANFLKQPGDRVEVDEPIAQIETDKVTIDVASPEAGVLQKFVANEGDTVEPGTKIAIISKSGEGVAHVAPSEQPPSKADSKASADKKNAVKEKPKEETSLPKPKAETSPPRPKAPSPPPSKPSATEPQLPPKERERRVPMTRLRKRVATRLKDSQNTFAMLTTFNEVDMTGLMKLRSDYKDAFVEKHGVKLGLMSGFVKAAVSGLQNQPIINAVIDGDDIIYRDYIDISIAVGTPKGLVVPVIRNADKMNFAEIEKEINTLAKKANDGSISIDEMAGGSFTISNGGVYGSLLSTPIINPPQSAILGMHSIVNRPMFVGGEIVSRPMMYIALTYDHRLIDGREAVFFLRRIKDVVEDPRRLLLDI